MPSNASLWFLWEFTPLFMYHFSLLCNVISIPRKVLINLVHMYIRLFVCICACCVCISMAFSSYQQWMIGVNVMVIYDCHICSMSNIWQKSPANSIICLQSVLSHLPSFTEEVQIKRKPNPNIGASLSIEYL